LQHIPKNYFQAKLSKLPYFGKRQSNGYKGKFNFKQEQYFDK